MLKSGLVCYLRLLSLTLITGFVVSARSEPKSYLYRAGLWEFSYLNSYYQATGNYTKTGSRVEPLGSGYGYLNDSNDFDMRWVPYKNWGISAGARVNYAVSKDPNLTRTNSTLTHLRLGTDVSLLNSNHFRLVGDFSAILPLKRVNTDSDAVLTGEGAFEATPRLRLQGQFGDLFPWSWVGYTYRDEGRASLLPFSVGTEYRFSSSYFGLEAVGHQYITPDKYSDDPAQRQIAIIKNGNALTYESVNSSLLEVQGWWRWAPTYDFEFVVGGGNSVSGSNISAGFRAFAGLTYRFKTEVKANAKKQSKNEPPSPDLFEEETSDGVDQKLFESP